MKFDRWVKEISLDGPIEIDVARYDFDPEKKRLVAQLRVIDVEDTERKPTLLYHPVDLVEVPRTRLQYFAAVRHHLLAMCDHEIRERLMWKNRYGYDPHILHRKRKESAWLAEHVDGTLSYERFGWMKGGR